MKKIKFLCALLPFFLLCGCFDSRDVKNVAIVMGIGVDRGKEEKYKTLTQIIIPKGLSKDGGGSTFENYSGEGEHLGECIESTTLKCGKFMYLSHATALLVSEEVAKDGIYEILDYFMRDNELRSNLLVAVAEGDTEEIMKNESKLMQVPLSGIASLDRRFGETSLGQVPTIFGFVSDMLKKDCATLVPVISNEKKESIVVGSAIFKNGKMSGKISNSEARGVLWLLNKIENAIMTVKFEGNSFDVKIKRANTKIKPIYNNEETVFEVSIKCEVSLLRDDKGVVNAYGSEQVKNKITDTIKSEIMTVFKKMQQMNMDVYGLENMVYLHNPKKWQEIKLREDNFLDGVFLNISADCKIEEVGNILRSAEKELGGV